ncbi:MAG: glycoside hydrolase family 38 C-terminal domain-containing protein [Microbacterium sp.]|uniref:alpha-mannosidase n=1 Tax=Microbacterium sp. TaxID=51671 RepID=UPI0039E4D35B
MHVNTTHMARRLERFVRERLHPALYRETAPVVVAAWDVPDEPVPFADAARATYRPFSTGELWGVPWGTTWFHVSGAVPPSWPAQEDATAELIVQLSDHPASPGFQAEGLVYERDGRILKAIEPLNQYVPLGDRTTVDVFVEAAANPNIAVDFRFDPTPLGDKKTAGDRLQYRLHRLELGLRDIAVWDLVQDVAVLDGLAAQLPESSSRRAEILRGLDRMVDVVDPSRVSETAAAGRAVLAPLLARPASESAHVITAVGHAHIDSAWLWPVRETVRKVARTFSNVVQLIEADEDFVFTASSAQQYEWLKTFYPQLFERVREKVREGRFVPAGGMWVESDTNMPGGEALARQFVFGKRFFIEEFGYEPEEVWLPDSFGYTAALPQIARAAGSRWFLTQKISWNETNRMPHHTFLWEGIDGTRLFTHFPPVDTYNSDLSATELARAEGQYAEKGVGTTSLVPYGWGDGGGGPTREMLAAAHRTASLEGSPRVRLESQRAFFERAEAELPDPAVWSGELYLELHRGTFTTQAKTKRGNRRSEHLLREAELWATTATVRAGLPYPADRLAEAWKTVLLQQFHDILPGSSIAWVHQEAEANYARVAVELESIIQDSLAVLAGPGERELIAVSGPRPRDGVPALGVAAGAPVAAVPFQRCAGGFAAETDAVRVVVSESGWIVSLVDKRAGRELAHPEHPVNQLQLHRDTPAQWDAWDIDATYVRTRTDLTAVAVETTHEGSLRIAYRFGGSRIEQEVRVDPASDAIELRTRADWHETEKLLKLAVPLRLLSDRMTSEIQFGHVDRPTHANTSWDVARFETPAHRWVRVDEGGYGVAVANDATYGHSVRRQSAADGTVLTVIGESLLRAPLYPDPEADQGEHEFLTTIRVGASVADAVAEGYRVNLPARRLTGADDVEPLVSVTGTAIVEAVKLADDGSGDVVVRLYEPLGQTATSTVRFAFDASGVRRVDLLERPADEIPSSHDGEAELRLRPFEIVTLRATPAP